MVTDDLYGFVKSSIGYCVITFNADDPEEVASALKEGDLEYAQELSNYSEEEFVDLAKGNLGRFFTEDYELDGSELE